MVEHRYGNLAVAWEEQTAAINRQKHGVSFEEAVTVFADPLGRVYEDSEYSAKKARFLLVGRSMLGGLLLLVHAERGNGIKIICARKPTTLELVDYNANA